MLTIIYFLPFHSMYKNIVQRHISVKCRKSLRLRSGMYLLDTYKKLPGSLFEVSLNFTGTESVVPNAFLQGRRCIPQGIRQKKRLGGRFLSRFLSRKRDWP